MAAKGRLARACALALGIAGSTGATTGADAATADGASVAHLDEVVVTARKTEERLQDVPLAIDAFTAEDLAERNVRSLADIAQLTPGLNFEEYSGGFGTPVIRGAAQARVTDLDQNVSSFFDGIYLPRQYLINPGVLGLERVEVVKGPQSALYGRNAFMGAINYVSRKPGDELRASAEATVGDDERYDLIADLAGPLVPGMLFGRIAAGYSTYDGDLENSHPRAGTSFPRRRGTEDNLNGWENRSYQARLVFKPFEALEIDLGYNRFELFEEARAVSRLVAFNGTGSDLNCSPITRNLGTAAAPRNVTFNSLWCGEVPYGFRGLPGGGPAFAEAFVDPRAFGFDGETNLLRGHVEWSVAEPFSLVYEYGKINARATSGGATDRDPILGTAFFFGPAFPAAIQCLPAGSLCNRFQATPNGDLNYLSHELRAEWTMTDRATVLIGAFTSKLNDFDLFAAVFNAPRNSTTPLDPPNFPTVAGRTRNRVDNRAVFTRIDWRFTDALRLGVEGRYSEERKRQVGGPTVLNPAVNRFDGKWYQFTPRASLDWRLTPDNMVYLSAAKGAKSGGFNAGAILPEQRRFDQDENWTYELGSKSTLLDGRLRLDAAVFLIDWSNQQISCSAGGTSALTPPAIICNLGGAEIRGAEAQVAWKLTDAFSVNVGAAYNDAKIDDGVVSNRVLVFGNCVSNTVCPSNAAVGGNQLARQSKVSATAGVQFEAPLGALSLFAGADVGYKAKQYIEELNLGYIPARTLANARVGVRGESWEVAAWAKNLADREYVSSAFFIQANTAPFNEYVPIAGTGRQIGLTARYNYGGASR